MRLKALFISCLAASTIPAYAEPSRYDFEWQGFEYYEYYLGSDYHYWDEYYTLSGHFIAEDVDGDGRFTAPEVEQFIVDGIYDGMLCDGPNLRCGATFGSYTLGARDLTFTAYTEYRPSDMDSWGWERSVTAQSHIHKRLAGPSGHYAAWTNETTFTITQAIPEPSVWLMLGSGLLGLAALARWRRV